MASMDGRQIGPCRRCRQKLLLNPENGMCVCCENDWLWEEINRRDFMLSQCRREKQELFVKLSQARAQNVGGA